MRDRTRRAPKGPRRGTKVAERPGYVTIIARAHENGELEVPIEEYREYEEAEATKADDISTKEAKAMAQIKSRKYLNKWRERWVTKNPPDPTSMPQLQQVQQPGLQNIPNQLFTLPGGQVVQYPGVPVGVPGLNAPGHPQGPNALVPGLGQPQGGVPPNGLGGMQAQAEGEGTSTNPPGVVPGVPGGVNLPPGSMPGTGTNTGAGTPAIGLTAEGIPLGGMMSGPNTTKHRRDNDDDDENEVTPNGMPPNGTRKKTRYSVDGAEGSDPIVLNKLAAVEAGMAHLETGMRLIQVKQAALEAGINRILELLQA